MQVTAYDVGSDRSKSVKVESSERLTPDELRRTNYASTGRAGILALTSLRYLSYIIVQVTRYQAANCYYCCLSTMVQRTYFLAEDEDEEEDDDEADEKHDRMEQDEEDTENSK